MSYIILVINICGGCSILFYGHRPGHSLFKFTHDDTVRVEAFLPDCARRRGPCPHYVIIRINLSECNYFIFAKRNQKSFWRQSKVHGKARTKFLTAADDGSACCDDCGS